MNMRQLLFLIVAIAATSCLAPENYYEAKTFDKFQKFVKTYNKTYFSVEEYMARYKIFKKNYLKSVENVTYKVGITKFSDLTEAEFARIYLNLNISVVNTIKFGPQTKSFIEDDIPEEYNWASKVLGPVKDQGSCGSCWAFATVANLEGLYSKKTGESIRLSEQNLVDCDTIDHACDGGLMEYSFTWLMSNGGLNLEESYPYTGIKGQCTQDTAELKVPIINYEKLTSEDEDEIKAYLFKTGPLAIALNASPLSSYMSGILDLDSSQCSPYELNHAVVMVGYGRENDQDFWIIRNSWGENWGENGYFRIARGKGTCGINTYITSAV